MFKTLLKCKKGRILAIKPDISVVTAVIKEDENRDTETRIFVNGCPIHAIRAAASIILYVQKISKESLEDILHLVSEEASEMDEQKSGE